MSKKKTIPVFLEVASVWFGAHCGPGVVSGNQVATYYSGFSIWGLFTGLFAMLCLGLCMYFSVEYARLAKTYDFKSFANQFFHPYQKFFSSFFELTYVATVLLVLGSCIATGAQALAQQFGWSKVIGIFLLSLITILLTIFGAEVVRSSSAIMTVVILVCLFVLIGAGLTSDKSQFANHWNQVNLPATMPKFSWAAILPALWSAILYCGFQSAGNMANVVSVTEGLRDRKDSVRATVVGIITNAGLLYGIAFLLFAFPDVLGRFFDTARKSTSFIPNLEVVNEIGMGWLTYLYLIVLLLAILTTLVGFAFAVIARYGKYLPMKPGRVRDLVVVVILLVFCNLVSLIGLDKIVGVGFKYLAYACIVFVIIPTLYIGPKKIRALRQELAKKGLPN